MSDAGLVASKAMFLGDMLSSNTGTRSAASWCSVRKDCLSSSTRLSNTPCIHTCSACVCVVCEGVMCEDVRGRTRRCSTYGEWLNEMQERSMHSMTVQQPLLEGGI